MNILVKIIHKFFPLIIIILLFIGSSCLLSPKERTNALDTKIKDNEFTLSYEFEYSGVNQSDTQVLLTWSPIDHELLKEYTVYRRSVDTMTVIESLYRYDTTITGSIIGSTFVFAQKTLAQIESLLIIGTTDIETNLYLDTTFQSKKLFNIYHIAATFVGVDGYFYFSNRVEIF